MRSQGKVRSDSTHSVNSLGVDNEASSARLPVRAQVMERSSIKQVGAGRGPSKTKRTRGSLSASISEVSVRVSPSSTIVIDLSS